MGLHQSVKILTHFINFHSDLARNGRALGSALIGQTNNQAVKRRPRLFSFAFFPLSAA